ncbi:MAG: PfkB family carbohydrate kinase [Planctomycetia bacterium]|nr:PfkB family carbohydrate kinase [Planctomycetia bacterium]
MSELLIVGSAAYDTIITPVETREYIIGGSGAYAAYAASFFTKTRLCAAVGNDWGPERTKIFTDQGIDVSDLEIHSDEKTFFWKGEYYVATNIRTTLETQLNVLGKFWPNLTAEARKIPYLYLANNPPSTQMEVIRQCENLKFVVADTMNFYIQSQQKELLELMTMIDGLVLNDEESEMLTGKKDIFAAGEQLLQMGPKFVIIKKGAHGSLFFAPETLFVLPAYPTRNLVEPTGAGDSFAGAMMAYLASQDATDTETIKKAMAYGTVTASFVVEDFSFDALRRCSRQEIETRMENFRKMLQF